MNTYVWYEKLRKPSWAPPSWIFGPVWSILYLLIAVSFGSVFFNVWNLSLPYAVTVPFILNLIFNFAFTPIQFGLKNNVFATIDILLVVGTLIWAFIVIFPFMPWVWYINIPYLLWSSFATILQITITYINRK